MDKDFNLYENENNEASESAEVSDSAPVRRRRRKVDKRKLLEKQLANFSVGLISVVFALLTLFLVVFPRSTISNIENRVLATFPEFTAEKYFAGEFTSGIATFYDDTVPYRDDFKNIGNNFKGLFGLPASEDEIVFVNGPSTVENQVQGDDKEESKPESTKPENIGSSAESEVTTSPAPSEIPTTNNTSEPSVETTLEGSAGRQPSNMTIAEQEPDQKDFTQEDADYNTAGGMIIVKQNGHYRGLELFGGGSGSNYISALNNLQDKLGDDVTIWSMPAPIACEFYTPANATEYVASQEDCFDKIASQLDERIKSINLCSVFAKHTEEPIYLRTDHHWTSLGAYYAARTFAEAAQVPFADISEYSKKTNEGYVGTLYAFSGDSKLLNDPENFDYYVPNSSYKTYYYDHSFNFSYTGKLLVETSTSNSYLTFLSGDGSIVKVETNVNNGRKLLVVKDSYGNAEIPFYTSSFETIYVVDVRYLERNLVNFIEDLGVTDVLFTMSAFSVVGGNGSNIANLIAQDSGSTVVDSQPRPYKTSGVTSSATSESKTESETSEDETTEE